MLDPAEMKASHEADCEEACRRLRRPHDHGVDRRDARTWDDVLTLLQKHHRTAAKVVIYPYAAIQHREVELT